MGIKVRGIPDELTWALVAAQNQRMLDSIGTSFHLDRTAETSITNGYQNPTVTRVAISSPNATSESTSVALVNEIKADLNKHFADSIAHNTAVSAAVTTADATDLTSAVALANALKAAYNTHRTASNVHYTNDSTNATAATDATDQDSLNTLLNEMKTDINAHLASAPAGHYIDAVNP